MSAPPATLEERLKRRANELGFPLVGIAPAGPADDFGRLREWLARGFAGEMDYLHRHAEPRRHPSSMLPDVRRVVMVGMEYAGSGGQAAGSREEPSAPSSLLPAACPPLPAKIARYARGPDYHGVMRARLRQLLAWLRREVPGCRGRWVVDTAPLLERDFARRAGLGWVGKNTMLINKQRGSYFVLGALLTDLELTPDPPHTADHCGTCTACLDACPTQAFAGPGWLDARRCISYLTIELRGPVPEGLRPGLGDWVYGCDVCQEVCPWNRRDRTEPEAVDPVELLGLTEEGFQRRFDGTALTRTGRAGLLRNAALVLGNAGDARALPALERATHDAEPLVREAAAWAIERIRRRSRACPAEPDRG
jgi:epoxyqueuosine reductase